MKTPLKGLHLYFWRSASGEAIQLADIPTSRVYYTWRMIWNHLCPKNRRTPDFPGKRTFGPFYTEEYFLWSLEEFFQELQRREDLTQEWMDIIKQRTAL